MNGPLFILRYIMALHPDYEKECYDEARAYERKALVDKFVSVLRWSEDFMIASTGTGTFIAVNKKGRVIKKEFDTEEEVADAIFELLAEKLADEVLR
jgi:hypothetical protein